MVDVVDLFDLVGGRDLLLSSLEAAISRPADSCWQHGWNFPDSDGQTIVLSGTNPRQVVWALAMAQQVNTLPLFAGQHVSALLKAPNRLHIGLVLHFWSMGSHQLKDENSLNVFGARGSSGLMHSTGVAGPTCYLILPVLTTPFTVASPITSSVRFVHPLVITT